MTTEPGEPPVIEHVDAERLRGDERVPTQQAGDSSHRFPTIHLRMRENLWA